MSSTCQAIQNARTQGKTDKAAMDVVANLNPITAVGNAYGSKNDSDNAVVNLIKQNIKSISKTIVENKCSNISNTTQSNVYIQSPTCWTSMMESCRNSNNGGVADPACLKAMGELLDNNKPVSQENINTASSVCEITSAIQAISQQEGSVQNAAVVASMQEAKGLLSGNKSDNFNCNDLNTNITNEQYITSLLSCYNETNLTQSNVLSGCNPNITSQVNKNNSVKNCLIKSGIISSNSQSSVVKNDSKAIDDQKSTGLSLDMSGSSMIVIYVIIGLVIIGVIFYFYKKNKSSNSGPVVNVVSQ